MWKDIHIKNDLRNALNISYTDYIYLDHTYKTQNNTQHTNNGYCDFSTRKTAIILGMSKGCVQGIEKRMKERGFLEKSVCGTMRKTTDEWNQYFDVSSKEKDTEKWSKEDRKSVLERHSNRTKKVQDRTLKVHDCTKKVHDTIYTKDKLNKKENTKSSSTSFFDSLSANKELLRKDILKKIGRKWIVANSDSLDLTADEVIERFVNDYHDKFSHAYVGNTFQSRGIKKYFQNWIEEQKDTLPKKLFELEPYEEVYKKVSKCTIEEGAEKELKAFVFDKSINLEDFEKYLRYLKRTNRLLLSNIYSTIKDKNYYDYTKGLSESRA